MEEYNHLIEESTEETIDKRSTVHPIETMSEYRDFLISLGNIRGTIEKINEEIEFAKNDPLENQNNYHFDLLRKEKETLIELEKIKIDIEQYIKEYEKTIDTFVQATLLYEKEHAPRKVSFEWICNRSIKIGSLYGNITLLEKSLQELEHEKHAREEHVKKMHTIFINFEKKQKKHHKNSQKKIAFRLHNEQKKLAFALFKAKELQIKILETKLFIIKEQIKWNKIIFNKAKQRIYINQKTISRIYSDSKNKENVLFEERDLLLHEIDTIEKAIYKNSTEESSLENILRVPGINELQDEYKQENNNEKNFSLLSLMCKKEYIQAKIELIKTKLLMAEKNKEIVNGWYLISLQSISAKEITCMYDSLEKDIIDIMKEEKIKLKNQVMDTINYHRTYCENIKKNIKDKSTLQKMSELFEEQKNYLISASEIHNEDIIIISNFSHVIEILKEELKNKGFWSRSKYSIAFTQLKEFYPHIKQFINEMIYGFSGFIIQSFNLITMKMPVVKINLLYVLISIIIAISLAFVFYSLLFYIRNFFLSRIYKNSLIARASLFLEFILEYGLFALLWFNFWLLFRLKIITSLYCSALYSLFSIVFLTYIYFVFVKWLNETNKKKMYSIISQNYTNRFIFVISLFGYISIFIYFFREAFVTIFISSSPVPTILKALQFILLQISLIFLLKKEQILHMIPEDGFFFIFIKQTINKYYLFFLTCLITIIIMSNPYVGYGTQVLYILSRIFITFLIIPLVYRVFYWGRNILLNFFVLGYESDIQEKFHGAKWWYTFCITILFSVMIIGYYHIFNIVWGFNFHINHIYEIINYNLLQNTNSIGDDSAILSLFNIGKIFCFLIAGYIGSSIVTFFIFRQIFHPLIIGPLLQNTIATIFKYVIVFCAFLIGLCSVGLQGLITKIAFIIGFFGFAIKEPFADFISYFIILVQRPIKIGDLIKIYMASGPEENNIIGTVRQITPRVTFIRQRNSQTVIVPNSIIVSKMICNWTYQRNGFVATEDIILTIGFHHDPDSVRLLIHKIIEQCSSILKNPAPLVWCKNFTPSGYEFLIRGFIPIERATEQWEIASQLRLMIIKKLKNENIAISFPATKVIVEKNEEQQ
jgi:small-conductance mechanosensitive channel